MSPIPTSLDVLIIGGFGHIGLPLGLALAQHGLQVGLHDVNTAAGELIARGEMPFLEAEAEPTLKAVIGKRLHVVDDVAAASIANTIVITVGTPTDEYLNPALLPILNLVREIAPHLRGNQQVMLRSTVFPGTTARVAECLRELGPADTHITFCPERIVQGKALVELGKFPQIVSGVTDDAAERAEEFFARLGVPTIRVSVQEAELAKLFTNAWRYIQFSIANQFYMMATEIGADFNRVYYAMTHDYERAKDLPSAGFAAGPCLLKDTLQLSAAFQNQFQLGHAAMLINEGLPNFVIQQLRRSGVCLQNVSVGILGMAFKADTDDIRDSLSYKLAKLLRFQGANVMCSDEFVSDASFVGKDELVRACDVIVIAAPHSAYRGLPIPGNKHVVDVWGIVDHQPAFPDGRA